MALRSFLSFPPLSIFVSVTSKGLLDGGNLGEVSSSGNYFFKEAGLGADVRGRALSVQDFSK